MNKLIVALGSVMGLHGLVLASNVPTQPTQIVPENESVKKLNREELSQKVMRGEWTPPTVEEIQQLDPGTCREIMAELYRLVPKNDKSVINKSTKEWIFNKDHYFNPCTCGECNQFEKEVRSLPSGCLLAEQGRLMHSAYLSIEPLVLEGRSRLGMLDDQRKHRIKDLQQQ